MKETSYKRRITKYHRLKFQFGPGNPLIMKIRFITATPINVPLGAPDGWLFDDLPGPIVALLTRYGAQGSLLAMP